MSAKLRSLWEAIREVEEKLSSPTWVQRFGGGSHATAVKKLAEEYGFSGRESYMICLCDLLKDYPSEAGFNAAKDKFDADGKERLIKWLSDCEVDVDPVWKKCTSPDENFIGDCYPQAYTYFLFHIDKGAVLAHGQVDEGINHAWVELPRNIIFDPVTQRFYRRYDYYEKRRAVAKKTYDDTTEVASLYRRYRCPGPWES